MKKKRDSRLRGNDEVAGISSDASGLEPTRHLGSHHGMDYREHAPPPELSGLIKAFWTLDGAGDADKWVAQQATPDGCVEIIRRLAGRSRGDGNQPESFAVGLVGTPTGFAISGDARFAAIRLWPWAWRLICDVP